MKSSFGERLLTGVGLLLFLLPLASMIFVRPVDAQCGASASSCKNCHEVNAQYPVNGSGDWHTAHAFGDFCAFCHAGNVQALDQDAAHTGMIYPLSDPQGSCQSCHPDDYMQQAQVYAVVLGVTLGTGSDNSGAVTGGGNDTNPADQPSQPIDPPGERHASGALIDYNRRYEIDVLGKFDDSVVGNAILFGCGIGLLLLGVYLIWRLEHLGDAWRKARAVPGDDWRRLAYSGAYDVHGPVLSTPAPAISPAHPVPVAVLPSPLATLDEPTQQALRVLLAHPEQGAAILQALARLDLSLIQGLQTLDKKDRDLLFAVVEQLGAKNT